MSFKVVAGVIKDAGNIAESKNCYIKLDPIKSIGDTYKGAEHIDSTDDAGNYSINVPLGTYDVFLSYDYGRTYERVGRIQVLNDTPSPVTLSTLLANQQVPSDANVLAAQSAANSAATSAASAASDAASIAASSADIATNTSDIATNTSDIATNTSDIATNTSDIATNTSDIATNTADIATNASAISTNATAIATNTSDIAAISNPNFIINGDFSVNQRGLASYSSTGYTVDRWRYNTSGGTGTVKVNPFNNEKRFGESYVRLDVAVGDNNFGIQQRIEDWKSLNNKEVTISFWYTLTGKNVSLTKSFTTNGSVTQEVTFTTLTPESGWTFSSKTFTVGDYGGFDTGSDVVSFQLSWKQRGSDNSTTPFTFQMTNVKLELGNRATPFIADDPATNLGKCQRYAQIRSTNSISLVDSRPSLRSLPAISSISGGYLYDSEL